MEDERQVRIAAESLLSGSIQSQRSSYTHQSINRTPDIILSEDLTAGARHNGKMSDVRRFFCLFITFDFLFTCLMWLICITIMGSVKSAFIKQIIHYNIKTSLFDVVMAAACRFTVLLLFYALLYMHHWSIVALSTTTTCAFLIAKVFLFDWSQSNQPVFEVLLILTSFVLAWGEAWFFDFRVIPQETQARNWILGCAEAERAPLLRRFLVGGAQYTESIGNFYTPMDSPERSDDEEEGIKAGVSRREGRPGLPFSVPILPKLTSQKIDDYKTEGTTTLNRAYELLTSNNWKLDSVTANGDIISYMYLPKPDGKIMKITGVIDISARTLINDLFNNVETCPTWNKHVMESKRLQVIDDSTDVVYHSTTPQGAGMVGARDFVILRHKGERGNYFISSGISIHFPPVPSRKNFVRGENGVSCWATEELTSEDSKRCRFTWIMNTNLKGWLPQRVIDSSLSSVLTEFMCFLRTHVPNMKD